MTPHTKTSNSFVPVIGWGSASVALYFLLFRYETQILDWISQGKWFFIIPILIAFSFSIVHGKFTGEFWKYMGIHAKH
ncbi:MAG: hypothetical protein HQL80_13560 [Magnetococcales bacterium]|nr:hypothetical protein [Magnetococcales bacterium]